MKRTYIHKEGWKIVLSTFAIVLAINLITNFLLHAGPFVSWTVFALTFSFFCFVTYFFRNPKRTIITDDNKIICPADGKVVVIDGKYLVAWHPKSSTENERTSIVIDNGSVDVLVRQIAGKVARRIVYYLEEGDTIEQGADFGFIKFGSRVDLFLPLDTKINIKLGQKVKGGITIIGELTK